MKNPSYFHWFPVLGLILFFAGCAQTYHVRVDALRDAGFDDARLADLTYYLQRGRQPDATPDLRFQESARLLEHTLGSKGMRRAESIDEADLLVRLDTGVSHPLTATETRSDPVYFRTSGYSRVVRTPVYGPDGKVVRYVSSRVWIPPTTEFAGYVERDRNVTVYDKSLTLSAWSQRDGEPENELWTLSAMVRDQSSDLRGYLPYLLAAALPYIGTTTEGEVIVRLKEADESVEWIRRAR